MNKEVCIYCTAVPTFQKASKTSVYMRSSKHDIIWLKISDNVTLRPPLRSKGAVRLCLHSRFLCVDVKQKCGSGHIKSTYSMALVGEDIFLLLLLLYNQCILGSPPVDAYRVHYRRLFSGFDTVRRRFIIITITT